MTTLLCVPITVADVASAHARAVRAAELGADIVEWRIDEFFSGSGDDGEIEELVRLVADSPLPSIVTCRPVWEGGAYDGDEDARIAMLQRLGTADRPPRYIDVEHRAYARSANTRMKVDLAVGRPRDLATGLILSLHDFDGRPPDLDRRLLAMAAEPAMRVLKVALRARTVRDNLELIDILRRRDRPTIALAMGECGLPSRVLAPKFGAFLTFAALDGAERTAPGQPTLVELIDRYRFRSIGPGTRVYGVVGWPVGHSAGPVVHNAGFEAVDHDGVYLPLPVAPGLESFKATVLELIEHPALDLHGLSVTLPHKENLVALALERSWAIDEASRVIGAANTIVVDRRGGAPAVTVRNTDAEALLDLLGAHAVGPGSRVAVLGAGGVARAAAWAAAARGASVTVYNRTLERAERLAADLGPRVVGRPLSAVDAHEHDVYINATSVGMAGGPAPERSPIDLAPLIAAAAGPVLAIETIYTPLETPFSRACGAAGWSVINGAALFVRQAAAQFKGWTGRDAPVELFERLLTPA